MNEQQTAPLPNVSPNQRLKELQSIPDNQKTEAQWDEIIELEIALAQGGRPGGAGPKPQGGGASQAKKHNSRPHGTGGGGGGGSGGNGGGGGGGGQPRKPQRKFHKKPAKPAAE